MKGRALLALSPDRAVRQIARAQLGAAARSYRYLTHRRHPEALHDFRVALRRLRSNLRAYAPYSDPVPEKLNRRLRRLARATNAARDTEVQIEWLRRQKRRLRAKARVGHGWLLARLEERSHMANREVRKKVIEQFSSLDARLRATLRHRADSGDRLADVTFARATGECLGVYCDEFAEDLLRIRSVADRDAIHAARIVGKRVRYLLEPLRGSVRGATALVGRLKAMQDRFGKLNDRFMTAREMAAAAIKTAEKRGEDIVPGLLELSGLVQLDIDRCYEEIRARYLGRHARKFIAPIRALGRRLAAPGVASDSRPRRLRLE